MGKAEDAMEQQDYEQALASVDSAVAVDSANVEAYKMRAQVLRKMADSTMPPDEYEELYRRAREAEQKAIEFDPGARSEIEGKQTLIYTREFQSGAKAFQEGQRTADSAAYRRATAHFGAAGATQPDSVRVTLNKAFARLNQQRMKQSGSMTDAVPILERYLEKAEQPQKNAYDILSSLYLQAGQNEKAIDLLEKAREDLSTRPPYFQVSGPRGLNYTATIEEGSSREVEGTVPDKISLNSEGTVSGTFTKQQKKGQLRVQLYYRGAPVQDTTVRAGSATIAANLSEESPLAEIEGRLLNAYNRAGKTKTAMAEYRKQIEDNPENVTYRYNYGSMLLSADRYDDAIEQLTKAVELEPGNAKAQYNLGAAYTNKSKTVQDSLMAVEDSIAAIRDAAVEANRSPTEEEKQAVNRLDKTSNELSQKLRKLYQQAIPSLKRAEQLADSGDSIRESACQALVTAYVQINQVDKAREYEECSGMQLQQGNQEGGGN